jgi:hypothetical protein
MSCSVWFCPTVTLIGPGFSKYRAASLHKEGMQKYHDILDSNKRFITVEVAQRRFGLQIEEAGAWNAAVRIMSQAWQLILMIPHGRAFGGKWVGIYANMEAAALRAVVRARKNFEPWLGLRVSWIPLSAPLYTVNPQSATLCIIPEERRMKGARWDERGDNLVSVLRGVVRHVRVVEIKRGAKLTSVFMFYGRSDRLEWDPDRYQWDASTPFMNYTPALGRLILKRKHKIPDVVNTKWQGVLPENYKLRWENVWDSERIWKEVGLIWLTWHRAVAINEWRGQINYATPQGCLVCLTGDMESILQRFWKCKSAKATWAWDIHILQVARQAIDQAGDGNQWRRGYVRDASGRQRRNAYRSNDEGCSSHTVGSEASAVMSLNDNREPDRGANQDQGTDVLNNGRDIGNMEVTQESRPRRRVVGPINLNSGEGG